MTEETKDEPDKNTNRDRKNGMNSTLLVLIIVPCIHLEPKY